MKMYVPRLYMLLQQLRSDATFCLLTSGKINPYPGPVSTSTAGKINCLVMNARRLKSYHKAAQQTDNPCVNSFASRTWLNQKINNPEILHSDFTILSRDGSDRIGGGVLIAIKTASFKAVKKFKPESEAELQQLEIIFAEINTLNGQIILFCFRYRPSREDPSWMDVFDNFLHELVCDQFDNMVISGDFNLKDILWDSIDGASGVSEPSLY